MYLKTLTLHGFKSFAEKTVIEFHKGVTGIVGPNGCGKSNVVDAVRWVLGETSAKALRGGEMADVIFNGTDKRSSLGMAEVTLTMAECEDLLETDFNEVAITRRVYRDGKSEYRLNNTVCRLKDIHGMLMDTGIGRTAYSIMEQGKIDQLLSSKPEDRRAVFEEAAGITKFKKDKKEALRKLEYTEANLLRNEDIIAELTRQKNSLQRQANKARRYQGFLEHIKVLDSHLSHKQYEQLKAENEELTKSIESLKKETTSLESVILEGENGLTKSRQSLQEIEHQISSNRQSLRDTENQVSSFRNRIGYNEQRVEEFESLVKEHDTEISGMETRLSTQQSELETTESNLKEILNGIEKKRHQLEEQTEKHRESLNTKNRTAEELKKVTEQIVTTEQKSITTKTRIESNQSSIQKDSSRSDQLLLDLTQIQNESQGFATQLNSLTASLTEQTDTLVQNQNELNQVESKIKKSETLRESQRSQVTEKERHLSQITTRLEIIREAVNSGEGFADGTKAILAGLDQPEFFKNGTRGVLASFLDVETDYIQPIESALGRHLQSILVSDSNLAVAMIESLEKSQKGEAAILPENYLPSTSEKIETNLPEGAIAWAIEKVTAHDKVERLVSHLLGNVAIVPSLEKALSLKEAHPQLRFVTKSGNYIDSNGVIHGGKEKGNKTSFIEREQELKKLETEAIEAEKVLSEKTKEHQQTISTLEKEKELKQGLAKKVQELKIEKSKEEGKQQLLQREIDQFSDKIKTLNWEKEEISRKNRETETLISDLHQALISLDSEHEKLKKTRAQLQNSLEETTQRENDLSIRLQEMRTSLAVEERAQVALQEQRDPLSRGLQELTELIGRRKDEITNHKNRVDEAKNETATLNSKIEETNTSIAQQKEAITAHEKEREEKATALNNQEQVIKKNRESLSNYNNQLREEEISETKIELRLETLSDTLRERYNVSLNTFEPDPHSLLLSIQEQTKNVNSNRRKNQDTNPVTESNEEVVNNISEEETNQAIDEVLGENEGPDWDFVQEAVLMLRQRLESIGSVNLDAIEEYDEVEDRLNFITEQRDDLESAKKQLLQIIQRIDKETKALFADTFEKVQKNFQETFRELFGKQGKASLTLIEPDDPLESGIEIIAKPPGKKLQSITLLSGGERSMTAVALLFSIYMVKPSPFCVLDELDAPLDESNIGRFLKVLDKFTNQSQFIIVTHNKRTMNRADVMYGITMEEFGVSKPVGMKFSKDKEPQQNTELDKAAASGFPEVFDKPE